MNELSLEKIWNQVLKDLRLSLSPATFKTWFKNTVFISGENGRVKIACQNPYTREWLEKRYQKELEEGFKSKRGAPVKIEFIVSQKTPATANTGPLFIPSPPPTAKNSPTAPSNNGILSHHVFDNFIVGGSNSLAHAAALAVAEKPGQAYNPLFLYGGVGVGKTHLINAVGNEVIKKTSPEKVAYVTSEKFTNDLIESFRKNNTTDFRKKYRALDLLIVDDIQFISGKEAIQEEFFHTFNALHAAGKQIILTSDRTPGELEKLEARLRSRFEGGLIIDVQPPDFETRMAILMAKCEEKGVRLSPESLSFIAEQIHENIRQLEGALSQIITVAKFTNQEPTLDLIEKVILKNHPTKNLPRLTPKLILEKVCLYYRINQNEIKGKSRRASLALPRQMIMYLLRKELNMQLENIGQFLGNRDHTTVMHGVDKISKMIVANELQTKREIEEIRSLLKNH